VITVLLTGSRQWSDRDTLWRVLDSLLAEHGGVRLIHGACPTGADQQADDWALARIRSARWDWHGKTAGLRRNLVMVAVARVARPCADAARIAGIPVTVHHAQEAPRV